MGRKFYLELEFDGPEHPRLTAEALIEHIANTFNDDGSFRLARVKVNLEDEWITVIDREDEDYR